MMKEKVLFILSIFLFINTIDGGYRKRVNENTINDLENIQTLRKAMDVFTYKILTRSINEYPGTNIVMSPFSIWTLLIVLVEGAKTQTLDEIVSTLKLPPSDIVRIGCKNIRKALLTNTSSVEFDTINSIFYDEKQRLKPDFKQIAKDVYSTEVYEVQFNKPWTLFNINKRTRENTRGRITEIVNADDIRNAKVLISNTIYFRGDWTLPFNKNETTKQPFYDSHNSVIGDVNMMHSKANFTYLNMRKFQCFIVKLPYGEDAKLSMYVILPHYNVTLNNVAANFINSSLNDLYKAMDEASDYYGEEDVDLYLPRFKISQDMKLNDILKSMGINAIFDPYLADLSGMSSDNDFYLSRVVHKARIEVTEVGTVATAASAGSIANRNTPPKVIVNKPFFYFIAEESTRFILVTGTYQKPELY